LAPVIILHGVILTVFPPTALGQDKPVRKSVAVGPFEISANLASSVKSATLTDILLQAAQASPRYTVDLPDEYLGKIIDRYRVQLAVGKLPADTLSQIDRGKLNADLLFLPTASRIDSKTVVTASLWDLKSLTRAKALSVMSSGGAQDVFDLVKSLWAEMDSPPQASLRVVTDGTLWDLATSAAVVYDGRGSLRDRARKVKPGAAVVDMVCHVEGEQLLKTTLFFESAAGREVLHEMWHNAGDREANFVLESTDTSRVTFNLIGFIFKRQGEAKGKFVIEVTDRFGGSKKTCIAEASWNIARNSSNVSFSYLR
jgi:hypothetical protein